MRQPSLETALAPPGGNSELPLDEAIRVKAFECWERRGRPAGSPLQDWLEAEQEIFMNKMLNLARAGNDSNLSYLKAILDNSPAIIYVTDLESRTLLVNKAVENLLGIPSEQALGKSAVDFYPPELARQIIEYDRLVITTNQPVEFETTLPQGNSQRSYLVVKFPIHNPQGQIYALGGVATETTDHHKMARRLQAEHAVTRVLAESGDLSQASPGILKAICGNWGWSLGSLWLIDPETMLLRCVEVWHAPGQEVQALEQFCRSLTFAPGEGLPGRVWAKAKPIWVENGARESNFPRAALATQAGLNGAIAFPIRVDDQILGVLDFFHAEIPQPEPDVLDSLSVLGSQVGQFIERKRAEKALHERNVELRVAKRIQEGLLPRKSPQIPGYRIGTRSIPAQETGGDFLDVFPMHRTAWGLAIGDASGHGVGAALLMTETRAILRILAATPTQLNNILTRVNDQLTEDTGEEYFVTLFLSCLQPKSRTLTYNNAGHLSGYVFDAAGVLRQQLASTSLPLGLGQSSRFPPSETVQLQAGDLLFLLTDGIPEAFDPQDKPFGMQRTLDLVRDLRRQPPERILDILFDEVRTFSAGVQTDDRTAMIVQVE